MTHLVLVRPELFHALVRDAHRICLRVAAVEGTLSNTDVTVPAWKTIERVMAGNKKNKLLLRRFDAHLKDTYYEVTRNSLALE